MLNIFSNNKHINEYLNKLSKISPVILFFLVMALVLFGIYMSFSATLIIAGPKYLSRHILFAFVGVLVFLFCGFVVDYKTYEKFRKEYEYRCKITPELLKKIQEGARKSQYLQYKFKKYF